MSEQTNLDAAAFTALGTARERVSLPTDVFDGTINMPVMHQVVKAYLANQRQGTASTKTRGLVIGGNQKPWKQKGTGRARQGSTRAPNWPGGGTVFGPHGDRNYSEDVPRKVKALARRSAFNARANEGAIMVIDAFNYTEPRTKTITALVSRLGVADQKVLILTDGVKQPVHLSGRNLPNVHVLPYSDASAYHVLWSDILLIEATAIGHTLEPIAEKEATPAKKARTTAPKTAAPKSAPKAKAAAKKSAPKAAATTDKKPTAKKSAKKKGD
ncbi:MAG: 50S ribosomal protein L4 [Gemmatimonadota bacterium]